MTAAAPETPATPGQAACEALFARWYRVGKPAASDDEVEHAWRISGSLHREFWADFAVAVASDLTARQPQPAPGLTEAQLTAALEGFNVDINDHGFTAAGVVDNPAVAARGLLARLGSVEPQPAPELAAAMAETRGLRELVSEIIGAFASTSGDGYRARVGIMQVRKWRDRAGLNGALPDEPPQRTEHVAVDRHLL